MISKGKNRRSGKHNERTAPPVLDMPETAFEMVNKYGTYEIQPTADTANFFPEIAQGLPKTGRNQKSD